MYVFFYIIMNVIDFFLQTRWFILIGNITWSTTNPRNGSIGKGHGTIGQRKIIIGVRSE